VRTALVPRRVSSRCGGPETLLSVLITVLPGSDPCAYESYYWRDAAGRPGARRGSA
jgi:hypothetical protein